MRYLECRFIKRIIEVHDHAWMNKWTATRKKYGLVSLV